MRATWAALAAAAAPVLADLERTAPGRVRLERHDDVNGPEAMLWDTGGGMGTGLWLGDGYADAVHATLHMTEQVQEAAFEHLWSTWPECPEHPNSHPLAPDQQAGRPVWRCPASGRVIADIGSLGLSG